MLEPSIGSSWEVQTKRAKIDYFTKNLSPPSVFEQSFQNFLTVILICSKQI